MIGKGEHRSIEREIAIMRRFGLLVSLLALICLTSIPAPAADLSRLVPLLKQGGYVVVLRHVATDDSQKDVYPFVFDDMTKQRQLSDDGRKVALRNELAELRGTVRAEKLGEVAAEFEQIHNIERAQRVGSVHTIIPAEQLRPYLIAAIERGIARSAGQQQGAGRN